MQGHVRAVAAAHTLCWSIAAGSVVHRVSGDVQARKWGCACCLPHRTAHDEQRGHAPLALKPCAQVHRHTCIAWQITGALGGRHGFLYNFFCTLCARARLRHGQEHPTEDGLSCDMLLAMTSLVSHTDPQEDTCLRRPRHCQKIYNWLRVLDTAERPQID